VAPADAAPVAGAAGSSGATGLPAAVALDDAAALGGSVGPVILATDLAPAVREHEQRGDVRWVWADTAEVYPGLLAAGIRVERCHDVALTERLLLSREGAAGQPSYLAAAAARLHGTPVPPESRPAASGGPQPSLFDSPQTPQDGLAQAAARLADLVAVHAGQLARIASGPQPGRFGLLVAAESAGGLIAAEMSAAGLPWRADVHDQLLTDLLGPRPPGPVGPAGPRPARLADLAARISAALGDGRPVNPDSPAQLVRALAADGVQVPSTRFSVLREIDHPAIPLLLEYKELARVHAAHGWLWLDTWVAAGRFRPEYVVGGVVSGRWATRGGGALQIPRTLRRAVIADPGWVLVVADAAQLEPRVLAALAGDQAFAEAAAAGDLYTALASAFGGDRNDAKKALLSAMYGGSGGEAGQLLTVLRRRFPQAYNFVETAAQEGEHGRTVSSVLGRMCPPPSEAWRSMAAGSADPDGGPDLGAGRAARARGRFTRNFVVQASAADWALVLLASLRRRLNSMGDGPPAGADRTGAGRGSSGWAGPHLVFFQHDEVIVHCPAADADQVVAAVDESAREAGRLLFGATQVSFPMTTAVVDCYADAK
jgi:DNA polymerase-1